LITESYSFDQCIIPRALYGIGVGTLFVFPLRYTRFEFSDGVGASFLVCTISAMAASDCHRRVVCYGSLANLQITPGRTGSNICSGTGIGISDTQSALLQCSGMLQLQRPKAG
jgi:hypothetical protein